MCAHAHMGVHACVSVCVCERGYLCGWVGVTVWVDV